MNSASRPDASLLPDFLQTQDGELCIGGVPLRQLALRAGRTPFYAYDRQAITARVASLRELLPGSIGLSYAVKANPMPALIGHLRPLVDHFDIASAGEMAKALDAGMAPAHISFTGPGKRTEELLQALAAGVLLNVESPRELDEIERLAGLHGLRAKILFRVNPDFELKAAGMRMSGGSKPFGTDAERLPELFRRLGDTHSSCEFVGLHLFAGSQSLRADAVCTTLTQGYDLLASLAAQAPSPPQVLILGSGFGVPYYPGDAPLDLDAVAPVLAALAERSRQDFPQARLVLEMGRYLVSEAGVFVTRLIDKKTSRGATYLVADGGMNNHLAASGNFGQVIRRNYPVLLGSRIGQPAAPEPVTIVGPLCTPLDVLANQVSLPEAQIGDLVVILQSGAYGASASPVHFLGHPAPLEILV